jgi:hypothetical protein
VGKTLWEVTDLESGTKEGAAHLAPREQGQSVVIDPMKDRFSPTGNEVVHSKEGSPTATLRNFRPRDFEGGGRKRE